MAAPQPPPPDTTFRTYTPNQATQYATARPAYPPALYDHIFAQHSSPAPPTNPQTPTSTPTTGGGQFHTVLDVGCGPGSATRDLARAFEHAVGIDPSVEMVRAARKKGGETGTGEKVRFEVCGGEEMVEGLVGKGSGVELGAVDLITSATAAHWFDMKKFWEQAAQLLRPGGSVAIWVRGSIHAHPDMPYAGKTAEIQRAFDQATEPYMAPGNLVAHDLYDNLPLPWTTDPTQTAFPQSQFRRFDWDRNGVLSDGKDFLGGSQEMPMQVLEKAMGTASFVTCWREANPSLVDTERDCVVEMMSRMREVVGGEGKVRGGQATALLMVRKAVETE